VKNTEKGFIIMFLVVGDESA